MENNQDNKNPQEQKDIQVTQKPKNSISFGVTDNPEEVLSKSDFGQVQNPALMQAISQLTGSAKKKGFGLAFTESPNSSDYLSLYKSKKRLLPDAVIKDIRVRDHLVASILRARGSMMSLFGQLRPDRFGIGIEIAIKPDFMKILTPEQYSKVIPRIKRAEQLILNCGHTEGVETQERITLTEFLDVQTRNAVSLGRIATEIIYDRDGSVDESGRYPFFRFRPIDVGTIVKAARNAETAGNSIRLSAIKTLESITGEKVNINFDSLREDKYAWLQLVDGTPKQAFTHEELLVFNFYPSTDVEHNGYPVTPLDTIVSSVTTHISIDAYKELYFRNGRASKGMLVIRSDEVDQQLIENLKIQFNASINSVSNSFRTPIFGIGKEDNVQWMPMNGEGVQDSDFAFMYDQIARNILSAFAMSPDELPGYGHLSSGTITTSLNEGKNEYKLTAARDMGLRPLILKMQTFFNQRLFPVIDPLLSQICEIKFAGLDAQSREQESARLAQDSSLHMNYDDIMVAVDKDPIGPSMGGQFPFNERAQLILDKYMDVSQIKSHFFKSPASAFDPLLKYKRDPFYLQYINLLSQVNPSAVKAIFAPRPYAYDLLKMEIEDSLEEE